MYPVLFAIMEKYAGILLKVYNFIEIFISISDYIVLEYIVNIRRSKGFL